MPSGEELTRFALELERSGGRGLLLSGGCDSRGKVPLAGHLPAVRRIKSSTGLEVNVHTGLMDSEAEARALVDSGADCFSVDIVQDEALIRKVMHLDRAPDDYRRTLRLLFDAGAKRVAPHVCVGTSQDPEAETRAIRMVSEFPVSAIILLSFLPAKGTPMERNAVASDERMLSAVRLAVAEVQAPVLLGCMRPRGNWELEVECLFAGVAGIAIPARRTVLWAEQSSYTVEWREGCCALHR